MSLRRAALAPGLVVGCIFAIACSGDAQQTPDGGAGGLVDAAVEPDAAMPDDAPDAPDAAPDAPAPDTTPPAIARIEPAPTTAIWLHEPIRITFDEAIDASAAVVSATAGGIPIAATLASAESTGLVVQIDLTAHARGALVIALGGVITDAAGNTAAPVEVVYDLPTWAHASLERGAVAQSPALAVAASGAVTAAWIADGRVVVSQRERGAWVALGAPLGTTGSTHAAIALDASGRPVVAWLEGTAARAARWSAGAWQPLPSPGTGSGLALASPDAGDVVIALAGARVAVARLAGDAWQPLGAALAVTGAVIGPPALAVPAPGRAAVGWLDTGGTAIRVHRFDTAWTALTALAITAPPAGGANRLALAARGDALAIAWDETTASAGVYAAQASGAATAWTRLGGALDVDLAGAATGPAIAIDAMGRPVVAWRERIESAERGVIARWTGTAWTPLGGATWLPPGAATPLPATLALHAGESPVIAWGSGGAAGIAELNGPVEAPVGMTVRPSLAGCAFDPAAPPARVLQTGCFTLPAPGRPAPHAGLVPYDVNVELWSDGTRKRRWIALPAGGSMTMSPTGAWAAPVGTFLVKEFAIEGATVETRFFVRGASGWSGFSYQWRLDGSDADLLTDGQFTRDWPVAGGGTYRHVYPSRSHCTSCHENSYGPLLGLRPEQLARMMDYGGAIADQLPTLAALGIGPATAAPRLPSPHDATVPVEQQVRGYMAANCAHCHNPNHIAAKDLRFTTPLAQTKLCSSIVIGSPAQSVLYQKINSRPGMPALGTLAVDPLATRIVGDWITGLTSCP